MSGQWYYRIGDREAGPVSLDDLKNLARQGRLTEEDRVRKEQQKLWVPAHRLKGLFVTGDVTASAHNTEMDAAPASNTARSTKKIVKHAVNTADTTQPSFWKRAVRRRALSWTAGLLLISVVAVITGWWLFRDPQFLNPYDGNKIVGGRDFGVNRVRKLLPPPPKGPSIPGLTQTVPTLVPGLEKTNPAFSPCLSSDLKTIVFASMRDLRTRYDLFLATRESVTAPFGSPRRIEACVSSETEAYPSLSPDGLELLFVRSDTEPVIMYTRRKSLTEPFPRPEPWPVLQEHPQQARVGVPQFVDSQFVTYLRFANGQEPPAIFGAARPAPEKAFYAPDILPFSNPWPMYSISSNRLRAFYGSAEGLFVVARHTRERRFGAPELFATAEKTGPIEGPIWVTPQEDVLFYCSPGPGKKLGQGRKLWMYRY